MRRSRDAVDPRLLRGGARRLSRRSTAPCRAARIAILGLGRLGSRELTADSDLDLVVLYDFDEERRESSGRRRLDAVVYYTRLTQRLVAALTVPTRRGRLYDVDLRLRPQGGKGPLASQFEGFIAYQRTEAELWEHMALTRARVIAGDEAFGAAVADAIADDRRLPRASPPRSAAEVRAMRELIATEKGDQDPWDLKLAPGGLTDLDFLAQALVLAHASDHPSLVGTGDAAACSPRPRRLGLLPEAGRARARRSARALHRGLPVAALGDRGSLRRGRGSAGDPEAARGGCRPARREGAARAPERDAGRVSRKVFARRLDAMASLSRRQER